MTYINTASKVHTLYNKIYTKGKIAMYAALYGSAKHHLIARVLLTEAQTQCWTIDADKALRALNRLKIL